jgi:peptide deformylase
MRTKELDDFSLAEIIINKMTDIINNKDYLFLTAKQISIPYKIFLIKHENKISYFINPKFYFPTKKTIEHFKKCKKTNKFIKYNKIKEIIVIYYDINNNKKTYRANDQESIIIQEAINCL